MKKVNAHAMELGLEVIVETKGGFTIEGKIIDYTMSRNYIWVENKVDIYQINTEVDSVFEASAMHVPADMVESYQAVLEEDSEEYIRANSHTLPAEDVLTMKELKSKIKEELKKPEYRRADIESVKVAVFNSSEGSVRIDGEWIENIECWDCEVHIELDNGEPVFETFGTFYNEEDAVKYARDMRVKLNRATYDITDKVWVYTC
ncbi:hypothetical protein AVV02_gp298 [Bacillus phage AvesoBmore]|uniref:Uncharacterized protein n=1 Tax=Bacillus phage AvesoBmore TaxID=1698451 RepID=A0A0K2D1A2_9CAUD|nr:hypothetical protein AVV02_gp002 [Bacillus phage AvesoBmore]YP_009206653.1 hypothetical protein AVV02_gp298 [Bacillus phage AvesoBmore]ALA13437.1 hypothetical protein AVESOBMORE_298 [Bacillus phage AvesoBmore]ALA13467.1 hypothetical protein AVESOBMORE_2 [Bacillus phage AvesoBmore]